MARSGVYLVMVGVVCCVLGSALAAQAIQGHVDKPSHLAHEKGCYTDIVKAVVPAGQSVRPVDGTSCQELRCSGDNGLITISTCGAVLAGPGCSKVAGDLTREYPACCPTVSCAGDDHENVSLP